MALGHPSRDTSRHPPADRTDRRLAWILFTLTAVLLAYLSLRPITSPDFWWHLSMGRATLEAGSTRYADPLAVSEAGEYVNIVWLFDVPVYLAYRAGGPVAVNLVVALLAVAGYLFLWRLAREVAVSSWSREGPAAAAATPWLALIVATLAAGATHLRYVPRPQAAFLTLLPLVMWLARRSTRLDGRARGLTLLGLLLAVWIWANMHASVVLAPLVVAAALVRLPLGLAPFRMPERPKLDAIAWATLALTALLPLLGPSGPDLLRRVLAHGENYAVRHIAEMRAMSLELWSSPTRDVLLAEVLAVLALVGIWRRRWVDLSSLSLALLGLYLTLGTNRFSSAWAVMMVPLVTEGLGPATGSRRGVRVLATGTCLGVVALLSLGSPAPSFAFGRDFEPETATAIRRLAPRGVIFNDYDIGGYLGFELGGEPRISIDSRSQMLFSVEEHYAALHALVQPRLFTVLDRLHGFSAALVPKRAPLCGALRDAADWTPAWMGEQRVLFLPPGIAPVDAGPLDPCMPAATVERCRALGPEATLSILEAMLAVTPRSPYLARQASLVHLLCTEPPDLAAAASSLSLAAAEPDHPDLPWLEGMFLTAQGRLEEAESALAQAPGDHLSAQLLRLEVLRRLDRPSRVSRIARRLVIETEDRDIPRLRAYLAWACEAEGDVPCAVRESLRAAESGDPAAREQLRRLLEAGKVPPRDAELARAALALPSGSS